MILPHFYRLCITVTVWLSVLMWIFFFGGGDFDFFLGGVNFPPEMPRINTGFVVTVIAFTFNIIWHVDSVIMFLLFLLYICFYVNSDFRRICATMFCDYNSLRFRWRTVMLVTSDFPHSPEVNAWTIFILLLLPRYATQSAWSIL